MSVIPTGEMLGMLVGVADRYLTIAPTEKSLSSSVGLFSYPSDRRSETGPAKDRAQQVHRSDSTRSNLSLLRCFSTYFTLPDMEISNFPIIASAPRARGNVKR